MCLKRAAGRAGIIAKLVPYSGTAENCFFDQVKEVEFVTTPDYDAVLAAVRHFI